MIRSCLLLLALLAAVGVGGAAVYLRPSLVPEAEHAVHQVASWASRELAHAPSSPTPSTGTRTAPVTLITPAPAAASLADWTPADCAWAEGTMSLDHSLDAAEAQRIATGQDTRYGTGQTVVAYYLAFAADWQRALDQITEVCDGTGMPTAEEQAATLQAFTTAIAAHEGDAARVAAGNTPGRLWDDVEGFFKVGDGWAIKWDKEWIGYYQRLTAMFAELPAA